MTQIFEAAARVSTIWSLAAFAIAAVLMLTIKKKGPGVIAALVAIVILGLVPIIGSLYVYAIKTPEIYRLRVTVLSPMRVPVNDAKVTSSTGGEPKKVEGGWQFDIPAASKPANGQLVVYAKVDDTALTGETEVHLADDYNPLATILLRADQSATVRGIVLDDNGAALADATVSVVGYGNEGVKTGADGGFSLPAMWRRTGWSLSTFFRIVRISTRMSRTATLMRTAKSPKNSTPWRGVSYTSTRISMSR